MVTLEGGRKAEFPHMRCLWRRWRDSQPERSEGGRTCGVGKVWRDCGIVLRGGCSDFGVCGLIVVWFVRLVFYVRVHESMGPVRYFDMGQ